MALYTDGSAWSLNSMGETAVAVCDSVGSSYEDISTGNKGGRGPLCGALLRLWPGGRIERPEDCSVEDWNLTMSKNQRWSYPAEYSGNVTSLMSILSNLDLEIQAISRLLRLGKQGRLWEQNFHSAVYSCKLLCRYVGLHIEITENMVSTIAASGGSTVNKLGVVLPILKQAKSECVATVDSLLASKCVSGRDIEGLKNDLILFKESVIRFAREELEQLLFLIRRHFDESQYYMLVDTALTMAGMTHDLPSKLKCAKLTSIVLGGLPKEQRLERAMILVGYSRIPAWLHWHLLSKFVYRKYVMKPLSRIAGASCGDRNSSELRKNDYSAKEAGRRRVSDVSLPGRLEITRFSVS